jgi:hypothetical protein
VAVRADAHQARAQAPGLSQHELTPPLDDDPYFRPPLSNNIVLTRLTEIYRIVSSKALDQGEGSQNVLGGERKVLEISKSADAEQKKGCC